MREEITNLKLALTLLNEKKILVPRSAKNKTLILMQEGKIIVSNANVTYTISKNDFAAIYQNETFFIYEEDHIDSTLQNQKDAEYYSWRHK